MSPKRRRDPPMIMRPWGVGPKPGLPREKCENCGLDRFTLLDQRMGTAPGDKAEWELCWAPDDDTCRLMKRGKQPLH